MRNPKQSEFQWAYSSPNFRPDYVMDRQQAAKMIRLWRSFHGKANCTVKRTALHTVRVSMGSTFAITTWKDVL